MKNYFRIFALYYSFFLTFAYSSDHSDKFDLVTLKVIHSDKEGLKLNLDALQKRIDYRFRDPRLLELALRRDNRDLGHSDAACGYERLEFVGDRVLELMTRDMLWRTYPNLPAIDRHAFCEDLVKNTTLADLGKLLGLFEASHKAGLCSESWETIGAHDQGDFVESLFGALYYDGGSAPCEVFFQKHFSDKSTSPSIQKIYRELNNTYKKHRGNPQPILVPESLFTAQKPWYTFIGEAVLKLGLSDFLYARYPNKTIPCNSDLESIDRLTYIFTDLFKNLHLTPLIQSVCERWTKDDFTAYLGQMHTTSGYKAAYDYLVWVYTRREAPEVIRTTLKKSISDPEGTIYLVQPYIKTRVAPRTMLTQILILLGRELEKPVKNTGVQPASNFVAEISCVGLFNETGTAPKKTDAEAQACQKALRHLASGYMADALCEALHKYDENELLVAQQLLEWLLLDLGYHGFSYFPLGQLDCGNLKFWRYEVQGPGIEPVIGEGCSPQTAKMLALSACIRSILDIQKLKILNQDTLKEQIELKVAEALQNKELIEYRDPSNVLIQISDLEGLELQPQIIKSGPDHAPLFQYKLRNPPVVAEGRTKAEAKRLATTEALKRLRSSKESIIYLSQDNETTPLKLITRWDSQRTRTLETAVVQKSPTALVELSSRHVLLLKERLCCFGMEVVITPLEKRVMNGQRLIDVCLMAESRSFPGHGTKALYACLSALKVAAMQYCPELSLLERSDFLLQRCEPVRAPMISPPPPIKVTTKKIVPGPNKAIPINKAVKSPAGKKPTKAGAKGGNSRGPAKATAAKVAAPKSSGVKGAKKPGIKNNKK